MGLEIAPQDEMQLSKALNFALKEHLLKVFQYVVGKLPDINVAMGRTSLSPLLMAIQGGNYAAVQWLSEQPGINFFATDCNGLSAIHLAAETGNLKVLELVYTHISDPNYVVVKHDGISILDLETPIYTAAHSGHLEAIKFFYQKGADLNARNALKETPLMRAVLGGGSLPVVKYLVQHGARVNDKDDLSRTALDSACTHLNVEVCRLLINAGATQSDTAYAQIRTSIESSRPFTPDTICEAKISGLERIIEFSEKQRLAEEPGFVTGCVISKGFTESTH